MKFIRLTLLLSALSVCGVAQAKSGFYFGLGVGGALISGDSGIPLKNPDRDPDYDLQNPGPGIHTTCKPGKCPNTDLRKLTTTDVGSGVAFDFRLGFNILGFLALEFDASVSGNNLGDSDKIEGQGGLFGLIKIFPAQPFKEVADRWWDPYVMLGAGAHFIAYQPDAHPPETMNTDGRGFYPGFAMKYGLGCDFHTTPFLSLGVDLAFMNTFHSTYIIDNDKGTTSETRDTAGSFVFQPTVKVTFHFSPN